MVKNWLRTPKRGGASLSLDDTACHDQRARVESRLRANGYLGYVVNELGGQPQYGGHGHCDDHD